MTPSALDDVTVLDISQGIAGPLCAKLLGDFGADVIKAEPPSGDPARTMGPFFNDDPHPEKSLLFLLANLNKRGITLNLETPTGRQMFQELARRADVVVESFRPGYLASLGLHYANLEKINPRIVLVSITPFGQTGPYSQYKGEEIVAYATAGIMNVSGLADREPLKHGGFQSQYEVGINGALSTAFSLLIRDMTGEGQHVDVSIQEVVASSLISDHTQYSWAGCVRGRQPAAGGVLGYMTPCKDGHFILQPGGAGVEWNDLADFLARPELKESRFAIAAQRLSHGAELDAIVLDAVKDRTMADIFEAACGQYRLRCGIDQGPAELAHCPQLEDREFYQVVDHPVMGNIRVPFRLFNMSETPVEYRMPAPLLGQHNQDVYTKLLGYSKEDMVAFRSAGVI